VCVRVSDRLIDGDDFKIDIAIEKVGFYCSCAGTSFCYRSDSALGMTNEDGKCLRNSRCNHVEGITEVQRRM
jgi:hypothetical protein